MKKTLISGAIGAGLLLMAVVPAFAADCENTTTGPHSFNKCKITAKKKVSLDVDNHATVKNDVDNKVDSGKNEQNKNTLGGDPGIVSGAAGATVDLTNKVNKVKLTVDQGSNCECGSALGGNSITGPKSKNIVEIKDSKTVHIDIDNHAKVTNDVDNKINSGKNESNGNTVGGSITSGDATAQTTITNRVNSVEVNVNQ